MQGEGYKDWRTMVPLAIQLSAIIKSGEEDNVV